MKDTVATWAEKAEEYNQRFKKGKHYIEQDLKTKIRKAAWAKEEAEKKAYAAMSSTNRRAYREGIHNHNLQTWGFE